MAKNQSLNSAEIRQLITLLENKGYKETYSIVDMLEDMSLEFSSIETNVNELISGLLILDKKVGDNADSEWWDIRTAIVIAIEFGQHSRRFFDGSRLSYDDIPEDADEDEVRTSHAISLLEKL